MSLTTALLDALSELHEQGQIQHNIDPRAVLVVERRGGAAFKIYELGPRHLPDPNILPGTLIRDGQVLVNLRYISPEYIRQRPLDARHDLFAVGVVLHQLLTGAHPFGADNDIARMAAILAGLPQDLEFPPGRDRPALVAFVRRLLARAAMASAKSSGADGEQSRPVKRLLLLERYLRNGVTPASLVLSVLPIVPRSLRKRGTPAFDLDELYRGVLQASTRLSLMHKVAAPVMVERHQRENMIRHIEGLFANGRGGRRFTAWDRPDDDAEEGRALFSLSDLLRSLSLDVSRVFEGRRVAIEATEEEAAALRGVGIQIVND